VFAGLCGTTGDQHIDNAVSYTCVHICFSNSAVDMFSKISWVRYVSDLASSPYICPINVKRRKAISGYLALAELFSAEFRPAEDSYRLYNETCFCGTYQPADDWQNGEKGERKK
jgi:hypothetical protein